MAASRSHRLFATLLQRFIAAALGMFCVAVTSRHAAFAEIKTWTAGGVSVTWDDAGNWSSTGVPTAGDSVLLPYLIPNPGNALANPATLSLGAGSVANDLRFQNNYTLSGGALTTSQLYAEVGTASVIGSMLSGTGGLLKSGGGSIRLANAGNDYTGITTIANGELVISSAGALGADSSAITITESNPVPASTAVIGYPGGSLVLDGNPGGFTLSRDINVVGNGPGGRSGAITSVGNNTLSGIVTTASTSLASTFRNTRIIPTNGTLTFSGTLNVLGTAGATLTTLGGINSAGVANSVISGALAGTGTLEKAGSGTLFLDPASTAGFGGRLWISGAAGVGQSSVRVTSGTAADGTNIFGTSNATGGSASVVMYGGVLEIRSDTSIDFSRNVFQRFASTYVAAPSATGGTINGTMTFGELSLFANTTATFTSRNGYGFTFANSTQNSSNEVNTITNNLGGTLRFNGNVWNNNDDTARTLTINGSGNTFIGSSINSGGAGTKTLTKAGASLLTIAGNATTLSGPVNINAGAIMVTDFRSLNNNTGTINLGDAGTAGSLIFGVTGSAATAAGLTGTNKVINLNGTTGGAGLYASQAGWNPVVINFLTSGSGSKTLTLGGSNAANNTINAAIPDGTSSSVTTLSKVGPGTWVLGGANTYSGTTTISDGTLKLQANAATSTILSSTNAVTFGNTNGFAGGTLEFVGQPGANNVQSLGTLSPSQGANTILVTPGSGGSASLSFANLATSGGSGLNIVGADATLNTVAFAQVNGLVGTNGLLARNVYWNGADFAYRTASTGIVRAPVYGTDAGFVTAAAGAATLSASANNEVIGNITSQTSISVPTVKFSGNRTLTLGSGQTLTLTGAGLLGTGGSSLLSGGTLAMGGTALVARVNLAGDVLEIASLMTGSGGLTKNGGGTLVLSSVANGQTGTISINEGTLRLSGAGARLGAAADLVIRQGATLDLNGVTPGTNTQALTNAGTVTSSAPATFTVGGSNGTGTSYGVVTGAVSLTKIGTGAQSWLGLSTYTGATRIGSTGLVTVDVLADIGEASGIGRGNAADNAGSLVFNGSTGGLVYAGVVRPLGAGDPGLALGSQSASTNRLFTLAGTAAGSGATLSSSVSNNNAIVWSNTGAIAFGSGATAQTLILRGASTGDNTFNPQLTDNIANRTSLTKSDAGQWNLGNSNNTYTGLTTVSEGILALNTPGALPSGSPLDLGTAATSGILQASGTFSRSVASSSTPGTGSVRWAGATGGGGFAAHGSRLVVALGGVGTPAALTWGTNGFVPTGAPLLLNSTSALDEVDFRNAIDLGNAVRTVNVADNTATGADFATMSGVLSGVGGGISKVGAGTLQLTGANSYSGATAITAGALVVSSLGSSTSLANTPTSLGVSGVTMTNDNAVTIGNGVNAGASLVYTGSGETSDRKIRFNTTTGSPQIHANGAGPLILTNVANDMVAGAKTLSLRGSNGSGNMITSTLGDNGGALSVTADGGGIWILTGSNTYTGNTTVSTAGLGIGHNSAVGTGVLVLSNGSIFAYGGDRKIGNTLRFANQQTMGIFGDYGLEFTGTTEMNASTANVTTNNNLVAGKQLRLAGGVVANALGSTNRTWTIDGSGETFIDGNFTTDAAAAGVALTKTGNGTLILGGTANNFSKNGAALTVTRGTLRMAANNAIPSGAGFGSMTINPTAAVSGTATFDLAGTSQTINGLTANSNGTIILDNSAAADASLTFGANDSAVSLFSSGTGTYSIANTGAGRLSIYKAGSTGLTMLPGVTLEHKGTTGVTGGSMTIPSAVVATSGLSVTGSGSLLALTGGLTNPALITNVTVGAGSTLSLLDGVGGAMTNLSSLALGGGSGTGATTLRLNFGESGTDTLGLNGGTLSLNASSTVTFFLTDIGAAGNTRYDLITSASGGLSAGTYSLGATPGGFSTFDLVTTDTAVYALSGDLITGKSFWTGGVSTAWNSGTANWAENQAGTIPRTSIPGSGSDVVFVADTVTTSGTLATTLEQNFRINSLAFQSGAGGTPSTVTIGPGTLSTNRLEIAPQLSTGGTIGITMAAGGPTSATISSPLKLGAAQTWNVASGTQTLTLSGPLFGEAAVTKSGAGTVVLSGTADSTFNSGTSTAFTVTAGNLAMTNVAALGTALNANLASINVAGGGFYYDNATAGTLPNAITLSGGALSASGTSQTYSGLIAVTAPSTLNMRNANAAPSTTTTRNITLSGGLSGAGQLIVLSSTALTAGNPTTSTLTLNTNNSGWSGGLDLRQGMVTLSNTGALGTGALAASGGKLNFATAGGTTFDLTQNLSLTSSNALLEIAADASGTPVSDMTVRFGGTVTLGSATSGTTALRLFPNTDNFSVIDITGPVVLGNNASISTVGSTTRFATISGQISDGGGNYALLINDDFGGWGQTNQTLVLSGSNTYGGGTVLASGGLRVGHANALGKGALTVSAASTLDAAVALTSPALPNNVNLQAVLTTTSTVGGLTLSGTTTNAGSGGITNNIASTVGSLTLANIRLADATTARTFTIGGTGATVINTLVNNGANNTLTNSTTGVGSLTIANNVFLSDDTATGRTLTLAGNRLTTVNGVIADANGGGVAGNLTITNTGTTRLAGANTYTGTTTLSAGVVQLASASNGGLGSGPVSVTGAMTIQPLGAPRTVSNSVSMSQSLTIAGDQSLTLSGPVVGTAGNAGRALANELTSGTLELSGPLSLGATTNTAARTLTVSGAGATLFSGTVSNGNSYANALVKSGLGRLTISGSYGATGSVGITGGELLLAGGSLHNGSAGTVIGNAASARGILRVNGGRYATNDISVGANATGMGALIIQGGEVTTTSTTTSTGAQFGNSAGGYGGLSMTSGTFATKRFDMGVNNGGTTVAQITGGQFNWTEYLLVRSNRSELTFGGTVNAARTGVGNTFAIEAPTATGGIGIVTIGGGSVSNAGQTVQFGRVAMSAPSTVMLNVNAGTLITNAFTVNPANFTAGYVNFGGGTLQANIASAAFLPTGLTGVYVNGPFGSNAGGAVFDTNNQNITVAANLIAPTGSGVTTIPVTAGGSGFLGAPFVEISGGGGFGASASANVDLDPASPTYGELLSITVTNPGSAYTSEPVITLVGGGGSGVTLGAMTLTANTSGGLTKLGAGTLTLTGENTYTGLTTVSAGTLSIGSGGTAGSIAGNISVAANAAVAFNRSDSLTFSGSVGGSGAVVKLGTGMLTLTSAQGYSGETQIDQGTLRLGAHNVLRASGSVRLGNGSTAGVLDLGDSSQTIAGLSAVTTAATATNSLVIAAGQTLTVNGGVTFGTGTDATINVVSAGGGSLVVNSSGANFLLGGATGGSIRNTVNVDLSGLTVFTASLGSGTLRLGDANTAIASNSSNLLLATNNTVTAAAISVGGNSGGASLHTLTLGSGANELNANAIDIGMSGATTNRSSGAIQFAVSDTTGTIRIRGSNGVSRATVRMADTTSNTGVTTTGTLALAGHEADVLVGNLSMAVRSTNAGGAGATLTFDRGTLDITTLTMAQRTGAGTGGADALLSLGGGTSTIGSLTMAVNTSAGGTSTGTFNVSGGTVSIGSGSGDAINMATAAAGRTATSALNLTGGSLTLAGNIVRSGSGGTETATITLDGGTLDLGGFSIGSGAAPISLVALSGNLSNLGQLNGGSLFTKTGLGTLTLSGSSAYSGGTTLSSGTLFAGSANAFGSGVITIAAAGTLDLNNFSIANTITNNGGTILNAGSYAGTQTVTTGTATLEGGVGGTVDIATGAVADIVGEVATTGTVAINGGGRGRARGAVRGRVNIDAAAEFELVDGGSVDTGATIHNAGRFRVDRSDQLEIAAAISGTGSFQKAGSGRLVLSGQNTYTGLTEVLAGQLKVNGRVAGGLTVAQDAEVGGSGSIGGILSGDGLIGPGNSPGIFAAAQLLPTGTTSFALEFSGTGSPDWSNATASINDVLRFTDPTTPIDGSLVASNVVNIYFDVASLAVGDTFLGGFFTDKEADFYGLIENATYQFFIKGDGQGGANYNNVNYYDLSSWASTNLPGFTEVGRSTVQATANFAGGDPVNGQVTQFVIVPEPTTAVAAGIAIGILAWALRRRKAGARG